MSKIEWTNETWNPVVGCTRVSAGCDNCYAVAMTHRLEAMGHAKYAGLTVLNPRGDRHFNGVVRCVEEALTIPLRRKKPTMWFVNSMSDLFHKEVPFDFIDRVFAVMALTPQHTYQILTKRPERMAEYLASFNDKYDGCASELRHDRFNELVYEMWLVAGFNEDDVVDLLGYPWPLPNVWLGTSCEDQAAADERIPHLLRCPAAVRFLSCEPLLGGIDLCDLLGVCPACGDGKYGNGRRCGTGYGYGDSCLGRGIDWVIVGGESGKGARPCDVAWIRGIVEQCRAAGVPCFVKQLGARPYLSEADYEREVDGDWLRTTAFCGLCDGQPYSVGLLDRKGGDPAEWPEDLRVREMPGAVGG